MSKSVKVHALFEEEIANAVGIAKTNVSRKTEECSNITQMSKWNKVHALFEEEIAGAVGIARQTINDKLRLLPDITQMSKPTKVHALFEEEIAGAVGIARRTVSDKTDVLVDITQMSKSPKVHALYQAFLEKTSTHRRVRALLRACLSVSSLHGQDVTARRYIDLWTSRNTRGRYLFKGDNNLF